jgi:hypothetical protein
MLGTFCAVKVSDQESDTSYRHTKVAGASGVVRVALVSAPGHAVGAAGARGAEMQCM